MHREIKKTGRGISLIIKRVQQTPVTNALLNRSDELWRQGLADHSMSNIIESKEREPARSYHAVPNSGVRIVNSYSCTLIRAVSYRCFFDGDIWLSDSKPQVKFAKFWLTIFNQAPNSAMLTWSVLTKMFVRKIASAGCEANFESHVVSANVAILYSLSQYFNCVYKGKKTLHQTNLVKLQVLDILDCRFQVVWQCKTAVTSLAIETCWCSKDKRRG